MLKNLKYLKYLREVLFEIKDVSYSGWTSTFIRVVVSWEHNYIFIRVVWFLLKSLLGS